jgi:hypothetical protein
LTTRPTIVFLGFLFSMHSPRKQKACAFGRLS